jgi:hypothetical protein
VARFVNFLILLCMCLYLTNLAFEDGSSASLVLPQSFGQTTTAADLSHDGSFAFTINVNEAEELISLLPAIKELHTKGMEVKWDAQPVPAKNNGDYYFFRIYNVTAEGAGDMGPTSVGNYAVNKHTADVRVWQVSDKVSFGDDGAFITTNEIERLQEKLRKRHGIDFKIIQEFRRAHLARRIVPAQIGMFD